MGESGTKWRVMENKYSFKGTFNLSMDNKGRIIIPAKLRKQIFITDFYLLPSFNDKCLILFPEDSFRDFENMLRNKIESEEDRKYAVRYIYSSGQMLQSDSQGRVNLADKLLGKAGIRNEVLLVGALDKMEIWDPETFSTYMESDLPQKKHIFSSIGL